jgi:hypothetical protein
VRQFQGSILLSTKQNWLNKQDTKNPGNSNPGILPGHQKVLQMPQQWMTKIWRRVGRGDGGLQASVTLVPAKVTSIYLVGGSVDFTASPGTLEKSKVFTPVKNQNTLPQMSGPWPNHYTNWAILVVNITIFITDIITAVIIIIY